MVTQGYTSFHKREFSCSYLSHVINIITAFYYGYGIIYGYVNRQAAEAEYRERQARELEEIKIKKTKIKAALYDGTSLKHHASRKKRIESLMYSTNQFHEYMPQYFKKKKECLDRNRGASRANTNLNKFLKRHNLRSQDNVLDIIYEPLVVSDDTKDIEFRPNKRVNNNNLYRISPQDTISSKRSRPSPISDDDSLEAGPLSLNLH
ncbi:hypothetical protein RhiirA4_462293 [Rhizophagus irregularis]|uniref:Uncharacterized protein n=1 Tax=Rhizophagus irregularis TaxID=588596 RepID=A0A2I1GKS2_9GLOM|nr:hypothetical protein RhiirA4_462293 [Rhizophagus irregularis]